MRQKLLLIQPFGAFNDGMATSLDGRIEPDVELRFGYSVDVLWPFRSVWVSPDCRLCGGFKSAIV